LFGGSLMFAMQSQSIFDPLLTTVVTTTRELAFTKVGTVLILLGAVVGMIVDEYWGRI